MKNVMIRVIEKVISDRTNVYEDKYKVIQLSSTLMKKYIEELLELTSKPFDGINNEIKWNSNGVEWIIRNREYRDDTSAPDIEEALYEIACKNEIL
jgi:hypothetical protein